MTATIHVTTDRPGLYLNVSRKGGCCGNACEQHRHLPLGKALVKDVEVEGGALYQVTLIDLDRTCGGGQRWTQVNVPRGSVVAVNFVTRKKPRAV